MTKQKTEAQLTNETIDNLKRIILFLKESEQYQHQIGLIKNLQSIVDGKNKPVFKGSTVKTRILESLKMAVSYTKNLKKKDENAYSQQEKAEFLDACMKQVITHLGDVPEDNIQAVIASYLSSNERISAAQGSIFFKKTLTAEDLLSALFMGEEELAKKIVRVHPDLLFTKGTYKMPLLNQDGTSSNESEQIYHNVTPLQLMLYTGDTEMWEQIFQLIRERLNEIQQDVRKITRGGPDLVKIDRDPTKLSVDELRYYYEKDANGKQKIDPLGNPIVYDLLCNPDGIFYREIDNDAQFFKVIVNPDTQEKTVIPLAVPTNIAPEDETAFNQFRADISANMPMNSSRRSSDDEHALISRVFGIKLERNGIHYELNGKKYQDTYDGCIRLKNAYRRLFEIYDSPHQEIDHAPWHAVDHYWITGVGMAQRFSMVHVIQRFCEIDIPFNRLSSTTFACKFIRTDSFDNYQVPHTTNIYPLRLNSGIGFDFTLSKELPPRYKPLGNMVCRAIAMTGIFSSNERKALDYDLAAVRLLDEIRKTCLNEIEQIIHKSSDKYSGFR